MATTRGKGTGTRASAPAADTTQPAPRARVPEDEIGGTAAPEASAETAAPARSRGRRAAPGITAANAPAADAPASAPRPRGGRAAAGTGVAATPAAPSAAAKTRGGKKKRETYVETAARRRREKEVDQLQADLRAFAIARPAGWNHEDWMSFLGHLSEKGHDVSDQQVIGARLERERLAVALEAIEGLGPRRVQSLVDRFQTMWSMRHAPAADVATVAGMTRPLAERIAQHMAERYS
jgi:hypothetical protein